MTCVKAQGLQRAGTKSFQDFATNSFKEFGAVQATVGGKP